MIEQLYKRNQKIAGLFVLIGISLIFGITSFGQKILALVEHNHQEEKRYLQEKTLRVQYEEIFRKPIPESSRILPVTPQGADLFAHLSQVAEDYSVIVSNFSLRNQKDSSNSRNTPHLKSTTFTFDFVGSRYGIREFMSRLEEVAPLLTLTETKILFSLDDNTTKGTMTLKTHSFEYNPQVTTRIVFAQDMSMLLPGLHPSYPYFYEIDSFKETDLDDTQSGE